MFRTVSASFVVSDLDLILIIWIRNLRDYVESNHILDGRDHSFWDRPQKVHANPAEYLPGKER